MGKEQRAETDKDPIIDAKQEVQGLNIGPIGS